MYAATDVAKYIISRLDQPEVGETITHLKLQKLLYYAQGIHLALTGQPLFSDEIRAWQFGPVVRSVWTTFRHEGREPLSLVDGEVAPELDATTRHIVDDVIEVYGQFSAAALMRMTHAEPPWKEAGQDGVISHRAMLDFFESRVNRN